MALKLSQLLAMRRTNIPVGTKKLEECQARVQDGVYLNGLRKTYAVLNSEDRETLPTEDKPVVGTVPMQLQRAMETTNNLLDADISVDTANQDNTADLVVNGTLYLKDAPVTFLLQMEKRIDHLLSIANKAAILDPARQWTVDSSTGFFVTEPIQQVRTKTAKKPVTLSAATDKQAAQVQLIDVPEVVGVFTTVHSSGSITPATKQQVVDRLTEIKLAIRSAVAAANQKDAVAITFPRDLLKYAFAPVLPS